LRRRTAPDIAAAPIGGRPGAAAAQRLLAKAGFEPAGEAAQTTFAIEVRER